MLKITVNDFSPESIRAIEYNIRTKVKNKEKTHYVFIFEKGECKSLPQLKYYWGVVLDDIANSTGYYPDEIHDYNKKLFGLKSSYFIGDDVLEIVKGLSKMSKIQATEFIEKVINYWTNQGVIIRQPDQVSEEEHIKALMSEPED